MKRSLKYLSRGLGNTKLCNCTQEYVIEVWNATCFFVGISKLTATCLGMMMCKVILLSVCEGCGVTMKAFSWRMWEWASQDYKFYFAFADLYLLCCIYGIQTIYMAAVSVPLFYTILLPRLFYIFYSWITLHLLNKLVAMEKFKKQCSKSTKS